MKIIIDIPDNEYKNIREYYEKNDIVEATYSYIYNGIPLDKVRERISLEKLGYPPSAGYYIAIDKVLQIIDKYKAESEE